MPRPPRPEAPDIEGPAGRLEALLEVPAGVEPAGVAVVCHPHPQQGGTLQNKVAHTLARAFLQLGMRALRFNFRGVGDSEGEFDDARGEVDDALACIDWLRSRWPGESLWIGGFSFGAAVAIRAAVAAKPAGLVSVAPAVYRFVDRLDRQPACPWLIVHGDADEVVPVDETVAWVDSLAPGPELSVFPDTGHFFHGKLVDLRETVVDFVTRQRGGEP